MYLTKVLCKVVSEAQLLEVGWSKIHPNLTSGVLRSCTGQSLCHGSWVLTAGKSSSGVTE